MLQYLVIQLDDTSVSYCHYENTRTVYNPISIENLKAGILFAMKENLMIQFVYPESELSEEYKSIINSIDHSDIVPSTCKDKNLLRQADIIVFHDWDELDIFNLSELSTCVLCTTKADFFAKYALLEKVLAAVHRLNVIITDIYSFTESDFVTYKEILDTLSVYIECLYVHGQSPQFNLLTDRLMLNKMNNCNAGWETITLAPDGLFYVCPAFYLTNESENNGIDNTKYNIGKICHGLNIKNPQLYKLSHAPLCRHCDAYQCKRCVWLNRKMTYELNTPSHEQCVIAHIERNASRNLLAKIQSFGTFIPEHEINEISYLDPFDVKEEW